MATELQSPPTRRQPADPPGGIATAVLFATAPAEDGGAAAALPWHDGTVLGRLLQQLADIGVPNCHVITRPEWEESIRDAVERSGAAATVHAAADPSADLAVVAELVRERRGGVVVALADIVTHRGALEGLIASPGVVNGVLSTGAQAAMSAFRTRMARGRVVSASSAYHAVAAPRADLPRRAEGGSRRERDPRRDRAAPVRADGRRAAGGLGARARAQGGGMAARPRPGGAEGGAARSARRARGGGPLARRAAADLPLRLRRAPARAGAIAPAGGRGRGRPPSRRRAAGRCRAAARRHGPARRAHRQQLPSPPVLGPAALARGGAARPSSRSRSTTRTGSCSTPP